MAVPIVTAVAVILAVFVPLLALPGVAGRLYAPLAVAVASAMTISLALSFTLVPVLVDRFLPPGTALAEPRFVTWIKRIYRPGLDWALRHGLAVQVVALLVALPSFWLATRLDTQFLPELDEGALMVQTLLPSDVSVAAVDEANVGFEASLVELAGRALGLPPHRPGRDHRGPDAAFDLGHSGRARTGDRLGRAGGGDRRDGRSALRSASK